MFSGAYTAEKEVAARIRCRNSQSQDEIAAFAVQKVMCKKGGNYVLRSH